MKSSALYNAQVHLKAVDLAFLLTDDSRKRRNCALLAKAVKYQKENRGATNEPICVLQSSPRASLTTCEREESGPVCCMVPVVVPTIHQAFVFSGDQGGLHCLPLRVGWRHFTALQLLAKLLATHYIQPMC